MSPFRLARYVLACLPHLYIWTVALFSVACAAAAWWVSLSSELPPKIPGESLEMRYRADLIGQVAPVWIALSVASLVLTIPVSRRTRWRRLSADAGRTVLAIASVAGFGLLWQTPRSPSGAKSESDVAFVVYNAWTLNEEPDRARSLLLAEDADVMGILEPGRLVEDLRQGGELAQRFPHFMLPPRARGAYRIIISRWPLLQGRGAWGDAWPEIRELSGPHGHRLAIVDRPAGAFVVMLVQARSPRDEHRWAVGHAQATTAARLAAMTRELTGLPLVMLSDLNATPGSVRSRIVEDVGGLRRSKPWWLPAGTWPSNSVWPGMVAIDDAWASPGVTRTGWKRLGSGGSDHHAALITLGVPLGGRADGHVAAER
ncbi:MAG: endonuclease/exonuclease/phosphatase family protein [Planctomycetota bacterium]